MHVEAWGLNHSLYLPYVMHGRPSVAASFSLRPQDSLWDGAHDARLTGDVVDEILGGKVDRADWSVAPDDPRTGARPRHNPSMGGGDHKNEVIETDCSIRLLRLESDGGRPPSNLPS